MVAGLIVGLFGCYIQKYLEVELCREWEPGFLKEFLTIKMTIDEMAENKESEE